MMSVWIIRDGATGQPLVSGANVPVAAILERLAVLGSVERVLAAFPALTREGFDAAIEHAVMAVGREVPYERVEGLGLERVAQPAAVYYARVTPDEAAADAEAAFEDARYDYELMAALRAGFGDL